MGSNLGTFQLCTLCLNEMEWLPQLYEQHKNWPGLVKWVFVEASDMCYAKVNPSLVSERGLSIDGTSPFLRELSERDSRVEYIPLGRCEHPTDPAQGKLAARQAYLNVAEQVRPQFLFLLDADEFYTRKHQEEISRLLQGEERKYWAFSFATRNIWRPLSILHFPLFSYEAKGHLFDVQHCKGWRWMPGVRYGASHTVIETKEGYPLTGSRKGVDRIRYYWRDRGIARPQMVHLGFASNPMLRNAKHRYYVERGEGRGDGREKYVECREIWEKWELGQKPFNGCCVKPYRGPIPEVFR